MIQVSMMHVSMIHIYMILDPDTCMYDAYPILIHVREHLPGKKMFSFGHCPNEGGGRALPELKNTLYIFLFDGRKSCTSCPNWGEGGGEVIWAMPERKHSFFPGGVP